MTINLVNQIGQALLILVNWIIKWYQAIVDKNRNPKRMSDVVNYLFTRPILSVRQASDELDIPFKTAHAYIDKLVQAGLLHEITGYTRNRIYQADEIFTVIAG